MKIVVLCCTLLVSSGCKQEQAELGKKAPALVVYNLQNQPVQLDQWKGKPVYLVFWSASCGTCFPEMVMLDKLSRTYAGKITVVAVNIDPPQIDIQPILSQWQLGYPVVRDQLGITQERYRVSGTPTAFSIDTGGNITDQHQGASNEQTLLALFQQ